VVIDQDGKDGKGYRVFRGGPENRKLSSTRKIRSYIKELTMNVDEMLEGLGDYREPVEKRLKELTDKDFSARLWRRDASLWKEDLDQWQQIEPWLGWLDAPDRMMQNPDEIPRFVEEVISAGFKYVVHMGMGGSSLAPLVFTKAFSPSGEGLPLMVLDTTDPATVIGIRGNVPLEQTLFIVASKSGTTAEPQAFGDYFFQEMKSVRGERAGENFVAITDPGSALAQEARERGYRRTFLNFKDVGGRYSALTYFGLVPAALMGVDVSRLFGSVSKLIAACGPHVPARRNPGVALGVALGGLTLLGRDKLTFLIPQALSMFDAWLEQLIAESTGKEGKGILPVADEPLASPEVYGGDRFFVHIRLKGVQDAGLDAAVASLKGASQPVLYVDMEDPFDLAGQFFLWEIATATAGSLLGINPFDQPNVQESKDITNQFLASVRQTGRLPEQKPALFEDGLEFYTEGKGMRANDLLKVFFSESQQGNYLAIQAYLTETPETVARLQRLRVLVRDRLHLATTVGFGPRFLHSTGQLHKGGPNTGLFLQLTADDMVDAPIPGQPYTFGTFKRAQALGDLEALKKHGRRVLRVNLGADLRDGLDKLLSMADRAVAQP
jgi:transaldolase / glucose-6-phosphate isomerase